MAAIPAFLLTIVGGLTFLQVVIDSHFYHEFIEQAFFGHKRSVKTFDSDALRVNWHAPIRASDVRKIGHIVDAFEPTLLDRLVDRVRALLIMEQGEARQRALAAFVAQVNTDRTDISRIMSELKSLRGSGLEGAEIEFADVDASLTRLQRTADVLAVVSAELGSEPDGVTLHGIQKQLADTLDELTPKPNVEVKGD